MAFAVKILPSRQNEIYVRIMAWKVTTYSVIRVIVTVAVGRDWKSELTTNQIVGFVTVPSEKENRYCYFLYCNIPLFLVQMGFQRRVVMWIIRGAIQKKRFAVAII